MKRDPKLSKEQLEILDNNGTEQEFSGNLLYNEEFGMYHCVRCGNELFSSQHKFDSGCGWPSFYDVADTGAVTLKEDRSHGMQRVEVRCAKCDGHLGHVFKDAPEQPTGVRFCINSSILDFINKDIK
jgi:peptide-methionine (R)-S-oxide reductase